MTVKDFIETCKLITNKLYDIDLWISDNYHCSLVYAYQDEERYFHDDIEKYVDYPIEKIEVYTDEQYDGTFNITFDLFVKEN